MGYPDAQDYLDLFKLYGRDLSDIYLDEDDVRYEFLFERVLRMLIQSSPFNLQIPEPFKVTARKILRGDEEARTYMSDPEKRHFMLSDLYDFIEITHRMRQHKL